MTKIFRYIQAGAPDTGDCAHSNVVQILLSICFFFYLAQALENKIGKGNSSFWRQGCEATLNTPNANMEDYSVDARDELHESEASQSDVLF